MKTWSPKNTLIVAGVAVVGLYYLKNRAGQAVADAGQAINPMNNDNIINRGFVSMYQELTGSKGTPGTDFWQWRNGGD